MAHIPDPSLSSLCASALGAEALDHGRSERFSTTRTSSPGLGLADRAALGDLDDVAVLGGLVVLVVHVQDGALADILAVLGVLGRNSTTTLRVLSRASDSTDAPIAGAGPCLLG
jgi:hypothetical protein